MPILQETPRGRMARKLKNALRDIYESRKFASLIHILGWQDMRHRYRRSLLGPFWLTASLGATITAMCLIFGPMLNMPLAEYAPYVAAGMMLWGLIASMLTESCQTFISEATMIRQTSAPLFTYVARVAWRNTLFFAHNLVIFPLVLWLTGAHTNIHAFLALPGFLLVMANLSWMGLILGILAARYRDLPKTIESVIPVMMFLTPIWWMPRDASEMIKKVLDWNPFYWLVDLVRLPMMGGCPPGKVWLAAGLVALVGWCAALVVFARSRDRIVYWL
jgi:lipopolysaccharide transport system permease protein